MVGPISLNSITRPGVFVSELASGIQPVAIAPFRTCYLCGSGSKGPYNTPTQIVSLEDAVNIFGIAPKGVSGRAIQLFFANVPNGVLFLTRVPIGDRYQAVVRSPGQSGDLITVSVTDPANPTEPAKTFEYTIDSNENPTESEQISAFAAALQANTDAGAEITIEGENDDDDRFIVAAIDPTKPRDILLSTTPAGTPTALAETDVGDTYRITVTDIGAENDTIDFDFDGSTYTYTIAAGDVGDMATFLGNLESSFNADATVGATAQIQNVDTGSGTFRIRVTNPASNPVFTLTTTGASDLSETQLGDALELTIPSDYRTDDVLTFEVDSASPTSYQHVVTEAEDSTISVLLDNLIAALNADSDFSAQAIAENKSDGDRTLEIRLTDTGASSTVLGGSLSRSILIDFTEIEDNHPARYDYLDTLSDAFDPDENEQGFLAIPEAFYSLDSQDDRAAVGIAMTNLCENSEFNWMAIVDCGQNLTTPDEFETEAKLYNPSKGHLAYYAPYLINLEGDDIPPSTAVIGVALRRYLTQNFIEPPAGFRYPIYGAADVSVRIRNAEQSVLNPQGINCIRNLRNIPGGGIVVWGARTRTPGLYRWLNGRVIVNVLIKTLDDSFHSHLFNAADGFGTLQVRIKEQANAILYRFWQSGAFYGETTDQAYQVICDDSNNPALDIEDGKIRVDIFVKIVPTIEAILISVRRSSIGAFEFEYGGSDANNADLLASS